MQNSLKKKRKKGKIRSRNKISGSAQDSGLKLKNNNQTKTVEMGGRSTEKNLLQDFRTYMDSILYFVSLLRPRI